MQPVRRDIRFPLQRHRVLDWHRNGRMVSLFLNNWSLYFPVGERFFIRSVRNYRDRITDPALQEAVQGFIGQEAMHGREHEELNRALAAHGMPVDEIEHTIAALLKRVEKLPKSWQLAVTVALEHFTALMGARVLEDVDGTVGSDVDPAMTAMWRWHALEETEHKAVAFDVYRAAVGSGAYAEGLRAVTLALATVIFYSMTGWSYMKLLRADPVAGPFGTREGWREVATGLFSRDRGVVRRSLRGWLDWFRPGFHPWDHDNRRALDEARDFLASLQEMVEVA